ncbi:MAG: NAD-dependent malic enzyme [bacterium]|nr:NAD-dependent malic enzyme [bacterium]
MTPSPGYSITLRLEIQNRIGMLGKITSAIGAAGGDMGSVDIVSVNKNIIIRDLTVNAGNEEHAQQIVEAVKQIKGVKVLNVSDRVFLIHLGGKIQIANKIPLNTRDALSMAYTPGVARVCKAIQEDPKKAMSLTIKMNSVAIVTDGTAVLGLGDIGPKAAMPVMEGKAMIFKEFANIDAFPLCLDTKDTGEIVATVKHIAPGFGGINLEDISAPRCFEIEQRLKEQLDIPVFHDDQHGTAVVVLAALINALKIVGKRMQQLKVVISGLGAAGIACAKIFMQVGIPEIIGVDTTGTLYKGRKENMNPVKQWLAERTNPKMVKGDLAKAIQGADLFLGVSAPGILKVHHIKKMAKNPIVFALSNPVPEISWEEAAPHVKVMATGRSDYPNQINNALGFPGIFRGALDTRASEINEAMKLAAAHAIAAVVTKKELNEEYIIPSIFNKEVVSSVSAAVAAAAYKTGVARRRQSMFKKLTIQPNS